MGHRHPRKQPFSRLSDRQAQRQHVRFRARQRYGVDLSTARQALLMTQVHQQHRAWRVDAISKGKQFWVVERFFDGHYHTFLLLCCPGEHEILTVYPWSKLRDYLTRLPEPGQDAVIRYLNLRTEGGIW